MDKEVKNKKLSVIVPVYNQEELVIRALESIPKTDNIETIVIDDNSTDNTASNLIKYRSKYCDKMILDLKAKNEGVGVAVNTGLDLANGEYVVLLGSDDYFVTDKLIEAMEELDGTDLVYFNLQINDGTIWEINEKSSRDPFVGSVKFMRRAFIGDTRCPKIRATEDYYFYQDLLKKSPTEKYLNYVVKHYNYPRTGSLTWGRFNK